MLRDSPKSITTSQSEGGESFTSVLSNADVLLEFDVLKVKAVHKDACLVPPN